MTLDQMLFRTSEYAQTVFKAQGSIMPIWSCETADGLLFPAILDRLPATPREKEYIADRLKSAFLQNRVVRYVSCLECFTIKAPNAEHFAEVMRNLATTPVRDHPDRRECIALMGEDISGETCLGLHYILRPEHGPATLSPLQIEKDDSGSGMGFAGIFANLLNPVPPMSARH